MLPLSPTLSVISTLGFAALKTGRIAWIFMHLNESQPLTRVTALASLPFLALMFYLTLVDVLFRGQ
ncbi:cytochrome C oxidase subunit IV family protein [Caenispirillum salinarum]|uniref:cytochrome C oxidase subunit IV family protein n=1 Tax=Caenispirillum salinarum TaxID=859058 RepID=UPI00384BECB9